MSIVSEPAARPHDEPDDPERTPGSTWARATADFLRVRDGDPRAMDDLVRGMTPVLWHVVRSYGLGQAEAEDVVQATWLTFVRSRDAIADERAVAGWLTTCARREAWRVARRGRQAAPSEPVVLEAHLPAVDSAEDSAALSDRDRRVWSAVGRLDGRCRHLLRVVAFEERPDYREIAGTLGMPVGSIGPTRRRCLDKLRAAIAEEEPA